MSPGPSLLGQTEIEVYQVDSVVGVLEGVEKLGAYVVHVFEARI